MNRTQPEWQSRGVNDGFGWMLVPGLVVGLAGTFAHIAWVASLQLEAEWATQTGRVAVVAATGISVLVGAKASHFLAAHCLAGVSRLSCVLTSLLIGGLLFLLFLDVVALFWL